MSNETVGVARGIPWGQPERRSTFLHPHVVKELESLLKRDIISGDTQKDATIACSEDAKRLIQTGMFSHSFSLDEIPVYERVLHSDNTISYRKKEDPNAKDIWDELTFVRDAGIALLVGRVSDAYQNDALEKPLKYGIAGKKLVGEVSQNEYEEGLYDRFVLQQRAIGVSLYQNTFREIRTTPPKDPGNPNDPWRFLLGNLTKIISLGVDANLFSGSATAKFLQVSYPGSPDIGLLFFILRGNNTLGATAYKMVKLIRSLGKDNDLSLEEVANIFKNSEQIANVLANNDIESFIRIGDTFSVTSEQALPKMVLKEDEHVAFLDPDKQEARKEFDPKYFRLEQYVVKETGELKTKISFSSEGLKEMSDIHKTREFDPALLMEEARMSVDPNYRRSGDIILAKRVLVARCPAEQHRPDNKENVIASQWSILGDFLVDFQKPITRVR